MTVQSSVGSVRRDAEHRSRVRPSYCADAVPVVGRALRKRGHQRVRQHVVAARHARLRVGIAVREQLALVGDDERVALRRRRGCGRPSATALRGSTGRRASPARIVVEPNRDDRRRQKIVVDRERRHENALDVERLPSRARSPSAFRGGSRRSAAPFSSSSVSSLNSGNSQDEVLEDAVLLPPLKAGLLRGRRRPP